MLICTQAIRDESDRDLVEKLYGTYGSTMLYMALNILGDRPRAEDAVSQAFVKIIDNLQHFTFEDCNKTRGLLVIIIRNICYDMLRDEKSEKTVPIDGLEETFADAEEAPPEQVISEESYEFVLSCLSGLHADYKDILRLKFFYEYTDDEISGLLGISPGNTRVRLHRARKALMDEMRKRGLGHE